MFWDLLHTSWNETRFACCYRVSDYTSTNEGCYWKNMITIRELLFLVSTVQVVNRLKFSLFFFPRRYGNLMIWFIWTERPMAYRAHVICHNSPGIIWLTLVSLFCVLALKVRNLSLKRNSYLLWQSKFSIRHRRVRRGGGGFGGLTPPPPPPPFGKFMCVNSPPPKKT